MKTIVKSLQSWFEEPEVPTSEETQDAFVEDPIETANNGVSTTLIIFLMLIMGTTLSSLWYFNNKSNTQLINQVLANLPSFFGNAESAREQYADQSTRDRFDGRNYKLNQVELDPDQIYIPEIEETTPDFQVWLRSTSTADKHLLITLPDIRNESIYDIDYKNGILFVVLRLDNDLPKELGSDQDWRDELWMFRQELTAIKLFEGRSFNFRASYQADKVAISMADLGTTYIRIYPVDTQAELPEDEVVNTDNITALGDEIGGYPLYKLISPGVNEAFYIRPAEWSTDGNVVSGVTQSLTQTNTVFRIFLDEEEVELYDVKELGFFNDFAIHPDKPAILYGIVKNLSDVVVAGVDAQGSLLRQLRFAELDEQVGTDTLVIESTARTFDPMWLTYYEFDYNTPEEAQAK